MAKKARKMSDEELETAMDELMEALNPSRR